jgi:soluble lytic murein transglycosylase
VGAVVADPAQATVSALSSARLQYEDAVQAIDRGHWTEYQQLRSGLEDYPLAVYLDYNSLTRRVDKVRPPEARRFLSSSADTPLPNRFLSVYLHRAGKQRRWKDYLAVMPQEPNSIELKCYYFRARLAQGDRSAAWEGAERLWVHGESRPKACDPLFEAWLNAGELSDGVVWARLIEAFEARQSSLMKYVAGKGSEALQPWSDRLLEAYRKPDQMRRQKLPLADVYPVDIARLGVARLARYNPELALDYWEDFRDELEFTAEQSREVEYAIARNALLSETGSLSLWLHEALARLEDDKLVEIRLRWALAEQDWQGLGQTLTLLSEARRADSVWRYWGAEILHRQGERESARAVWEELATERGYYSFIAADRLGQPYAFNHAPLDKSVPVSVPLRELPAVQRIGELHFHDEPNLAHSEWHKVLQEREDSLERQQLAYLAHQQGWHRLAIDAANKAEAWDALDLRFPLAYRETFDRHSGVQQVPSTELMAIARRESAFFPEVRSPVGARGLMQVMPATGKQVASKIGVSHRSADLYEVEHNVLLGSTYYRQLLDRYGGNRVFALAAYNAGPHRVDRWRNEPDEQVPVEVWIETIPYRETRNYVQAVLSYNVVFQYLSGDEDAMLTSSERSAGY